MRMAKIITIHIHMEYLGKTSGLTLLVIKSPPQPHRNFKHCLHLENKYLCPKIEGESAHASKRAKPRALIKVLKEIFEID